MHVCFGGWLRDKDENCKMPRRLPERDIARSTKRPSRAKSQQKYQSIPLWRGPVKAGEEFDVVIDDVGSRGDGIARAGGFLVFVPQTKVGDRLRVKITTVGRNLPSRKN